MNNYLPDSGYKRVAMICLYIVMGAAAAYILFRYVIGLLLPFIIAWFIALAIQPLVTFVNKRTKIPRKPLNIVFVLLALILVGIALFFALDRIIYEVRELFEMLNKNADSILRSIFAFLDRLNERIPLPDFMEESAYLYEIAADLTKNALSAISTSIPAWITSIMRTLPSGIFFTVILVMASFYISADFGGINTFIARQLPDGMLKTLRGLRSRLKTTGFQYLRAYAAIMLITFTELLSGFLILGIDYAFTLAVFISFVDILPILGVGAVLIPWGVVLLIGGNYYQGFGLLIMYIVIYIVRQIIEPRIVGGSIGLNPLVTLIAMYVGLKLAGFLGLILMPVVAILIKNLNDSGTLRLWKPKTNDDSPK